MPRHAFAEGSRTYMSLGRKPSKSVATARPITDRSAFSTCCMAKALAEGVTGDDVVAPRSCQSSTEKMLLPHNRFDSRNHLFETKPRPNHVTCFVFTPYRGLHRGWFWMRNHQCEKYKTSVWRVFFGLTETSQKSGSSAPVCDGPPKLSFGLTLPSARVGPRTVA